MIPYTAHHNKLSNSNIKEAKSYDISLCLHDVNSEYVICNSRNIVQAQVNIVQINLIPYSLSSHNAG